MSDTIYHGSLKHQVLRKVVIPRSYSEGPLNAYCRLEYDRVKLHCESFYDSFEKKTTINVYTFNHRRTVVVFDETLSDLDHFEVANYVNSTVRQFRYDLYTYYAIGDM